MILLFKIKIIFCDVFSILSKNTFLLLFSSLFYNLSQFFLILILSKLGTLEMIGQLGTALAISAPVSMFFSFRLYFIQLADAQNKYKFVDYFILRNISNVLLFLFILLIVWILGYDANVSLIILSIAVSKIFENISEIYYGYAQKHNCIVYVARSRFLKGFFTPTIFGCTLACTNSMVLSCLSMAFIWLVILLAYDANFYERSIVKDIRNFFILFIKRKKDIYSLLKMSFPLGIMSLLVSLSPNIPRYFIEFYKGVETLGIYTVISYIATASFLIMGPIFHSYVPLLANLSQRDIYGFKKLFFSLMIFSIFNSFILVLGAYFIGDKFLFLFFDSTIAIHYSAFMILIIAAGLNIIALCLLYTLTALNIFFVQPILYLFDVLIMIVCCFYFIFYFGLIGACYAACIVALFHIIIMTILLTISFLKMSESKSSFKTAGLSSYE